MKEELALKPSGPPTFSAEAKAADLRQVIERFSAEGLPTEHIQAILDDPEQQRIWRTGEQQALDGYRRSAHQQHPAMQSPERSARARAALLEREVTSVAGADFTGADLQRIAWSSRAGEA